MVNEYGEDKWPDEQRHLDAQLVAGFESLEYFAANDLPIPEEPVVSFRAAVAKLKSAKRREHWESELERIGAPKPPPPPRKAEPKAEAKAEATPAKVELKGKSSGGKGHD